MHAISHHCGSRAHELVSSEENSSGQSVVHDDGPHLSPFRRQRRYREVTEHQNDGQEETVFSLSPCPPFSFLGVWTLGSVHCQVADPHGSLSQCNSESQLLDHDHGTIKQSETTTPLQRVIPSLRRRPRAERRLCSRMSKARSRSYGNKQKHARTDGFYPPQQRQRSE